VVAKDNRNFIFLGQKDAQAMLEMFVLASSNMLCLDKEFSILEHYEPTLIVHVKIAMRERPVQVRWFIYML
jgi:hypothetical protein